MSVGHFPLGKRNLQGGVEKMTTVYNKKSTKYKRQILRNNLTFSEKKLWNFLRREALSVRFRRQFSIGEYIVDFYSPKINLVIELDGSQHHTKEGVEYDKIRENYMNSLGIVTIRFKNEDVKENIDSILKKIIHTINFLKSI